MVRRLTLDGDGVAVVVGQAGAGQDVRARRGARGVGGERPRSSARRSRGAPRANSRRAPASRARASPRCSPSSSVARCALPRRAVLVVDEASMVPTRQLARLVEHVARARRRSSCWSATIASCPAIEAGGAFRALHHAAPGDRARARTAGRRSAGSARRCALRARRAGRRGASASTRRVGASWSARTPTRSVRSWSPTGGRRVTPTGR